MRNWFAIPLLSLFACAATNAIAPSQVHLTPVAFSGYPWQIKTSMNIPLESGPNYYSDSAENIWVDQSGKLHLRVSKIADKWVSTELVGTRPLGYGTYTFVLDTSVDHLDPNIILGLFVWGPNPDQSHHELDIEFGVWGSTLRPNAQYVVQPAMDFLFNQPSLTRSIHKFTWKPNSVDFASTTIDGTVISQHSFTQNIPAASDSTPRLVLWQYKGLAPANSQPVEVVIDRFEFAPM